MGNLKWTKKKPTEVGWYWKKQRDFDGYGVDIVCVRVYARKLCIINWPIPDNAEWAGPIPEPE